MKLFEYRDCFECDSTGKLGIHLMCTACNGTGKLRPHGLLGGLRRGLVAFDLDGTVIDTAEALCQVYVAVGTTWMRHHNWRHFATPEQHDRKCAIYKDYLKRYAKKLKCYDFATRYSAPIVTYASEMAVRDIQSIFPGLIIHRSARDFKDKVHALRTLHVQMYVDDEDEAHAELGAQSGVDIVTPEWFLNNAAEEMGH